MAGTCTINFPKVWQDRPSHTSHYVIWEGLNNMLWLCSTHTHTHIYILHLWLCALLCQSNILCVALLSVMSPPIDEVCVCVATCVIIPLNILIALLTIVCFAFILKETKVPNVYYYHTTAHYLQIYIHLSLCSKHNNIQTSWRSSILNTCIHFLSNVYTVELQYTFSSLLKQRYLSPLWPPSSFSHICASWPHGHFSICKNKKGIVRDHGYGYIAVSSRHSQG